MSTDTSKRSRRTELERAGLALGVAQRRHDKALRVHAAAEQAAADAVEVEASRTALAYAEQHPALQDASKPVPS